MKAIHVEMILANKLKDDMKPIIEELAEKYKPKQLHFYEVEYFEK